MYKSKVLLLRPRMCVAVYVRDVCCCAFSLSFDNPLNLPFGEIELRYGVKFEPRKFIKMVACRKGHFTWIEDRAALIVGIEYATRAA